MTATLGPGTYTFTCRMSGQAVDDLGAGSGHRRTAQAAPAAVKPVTVPDLTGPNRKYQALRRRRAADSGGGQSPRSGRTCGAATWPRPGPDWLAAQLDWERVGASYDSFGDVGLAVDGLPDGLVNGVNDKDFTGLHRLEYGLWHGQSAATLLPVAARWPGTSPRCRRT